MLKPFIPSLAVVARATASLGADKPPPKADVSASRRPVAVALDVQRDADAGRGAAAETFSQRYQSYFGKAPPAALDQGVGR